MASALDQVSCVKASGNLRKLSGEFEMKKSSLNSYRCSHCRIIFTVRADDRLNDDKVYCEKCANKFRNRQPEHSSTFSNDLQLENNFRRIPRSRPRSFKNEIICLALSKRSCLVHVHNMTSYAINNTCIAIYGEIDNSRCGPTNILSQKTADYYFKKRTISLSGCAGIQIFSVEELNINFLIAFRIDIVQLRKQSHNKVAILRINNFELDVDLRDFFRNIMNHEGPGRPTFNGCYNDSGTERIFKSAFASERSDTYINCDTIKIEVKMTKDWNSVIKVTISTNEAPVPTRRALQQSSMEGTPCEPPMRRAPQQSSMEVTPCETFPDTTYDEEFGFSSLEELHQESEGIKESSCTII